MFKLAERRNAVCPSSFHGSRAVTVLSHPVCEREAEGEIICQPHALGDTFGLYPALKGRTGQLPPQYDTSIDFRPDLSLVNLKNTTSSQALTELYKELDIFPASLWYVQGSLDGDMYFRPNSLQSHGSLPFLNLTSASSGFERY